jgi:hypothetical protein
MAAHIFTPVLQDICSYIHTCIGRMTAAILTPVLTGWWEGVEGIILVWYLVKTVGCYMEEGNSITVSLTGNQY